MISKRFDPSTTKRKEKEKKKKKEEKKKDLTPGTKLVMKNGHTTPGGAATLTYVIGHGSSS